MQKVILHIRVCLISIILLPLLAPFHQFTLFSQTENCAGKLVQAESIFQQGNWSEAADIIKSCLKSKELNEAERIKAYHLLGTVYAGAALEKDAIAAVKNLLIMVPEYKIDLTKDTPAFGKIIDAVKKNLIPEISGITPDNASSGEQKVILKVYGKNFVQGSIVRFNNIDKKTTFITTNQLEAELTSTDLSRGGEYYVNVYSPILDGKSSNSVKFNIASQNLKFSINGVLPVPIGALAADKGGEEDGYAKIGYGAVAELNYPLSATGLGWISGIAYFSNGNSYELLGSDFDFQVAVLSSEVGSYTAIPIMSGLSYSGEISSNLSYILAGQLVLSFISIGDENYDISYTDPDYGVLSGNVNIKYSSTSSFGFGLGGGLIINNLIIISAKYLDLGKPEFDSDATINISYLGVPVLSDSYKYSRKQSFSYFTLSVGVVFSLL